MEPVINDADRLGAPDIGPKELDPIWDQVGHEIMGRTIYDHFDRSGNPISMRDWCRLRALSDEYVIVAQESVGDLLVSTVWVGMDHSFGYGPPLIFETMVFRISTGESDLDCWRYTTLEDARVGHNAMVTKVAIFEQLER